MVLVAEEWTVVERTTLQRDLVRIVVGDGRGRRVTLTVKRELTTPEALAPLIEAAAAATGPVPPQPPREGS